MRKYFLTLITFSLHNYFNVGCVTNVVDYELENKFEKKEKYKINPVFDDTTQYVKKGGVHSATWYNPHGARTASGLRFHKDSLTAAYNFCKMGSYLKVTNFYDSSSIVVKVTDRMGYKGNNHIDLSKCAFDSIGNPKSGRLKVIVEEIR
jgi:rare lipoprotein A